MKAIAQYTITNLNDFTPSSSPPVNPYQGQVWQDTGVTPPKLRTWDGTKWVVSNDFGGEIDELEKEVTAQSTALSVVNGKITTLITESTTTKGDVTQLNNKYNSTIATVDGMDSIIGAHTTKLDTQTGQILEVQSKQTQFTTDLSGVTARVTSVETNATAIGKTVTTHTTEISALKNQILLKVEQSDIDTAVSGYTKTEDLSAWISINKDVITSAVSATYATKSSVDGKADQSTVNTLSALITTQADKWTASFSVIGADGYTRTGKTEINSFGLTIYDGALTIKNKMGKDVLKADTVGNLNMVGNFTQYASNGNKSVEIVNNKLTLYNYGNVSRIGGEIGSFNILENGAVAEKGMAIIGHGELIFANKPSNDIPFLAMSIKTDGSVNSWGAAVAHGDLHAHGTLYAYSTIRAYSNMYVDGRAYFAQQPILSDGNKFLVHGGSNTYCVQMQKVGVSGTYLEVVTTSNIGYGVNVWVSDASLKTNIAPSAVNALSKILAIEHASFDWRSDGKHQSLGVVANQIQQIEPSWVFGVEQPNGTQRLQVSESNLIPYITKSIQEVYQDVKSTQTITADHTSELVRISTHLSDAEIEIIDLKAEVKLLRSMLEQKEVVS